MCWLTLISWLLALLVLDVWLSQVLSRFAYTRPWGERSQDWLLDLLALWLFLRAFGGEVSPDGLLVAFGLANVLASVPITPGGLGIVEGIYIPTLVGFGVPVATATVTVLTYRIAQYWLPILVGGVSYVSLRIGAVTSVPAPQSRLSRLESATRAAKAMRSLNEGSVHDLRSEEHTSELQSH